MEIGRRSLLEKLQILSYVSAPEVKNFPFPNNARIYILALKLAIFLVHVFILSSLKGEKN